MRPNHLTAWADRRNSNVREEEHGRTRGALPQAATRARHHLGHLIRGKVFSWPVRSANFAADVC
jgi:hypothetical protein